MHDRHEGWPPSHYTAVRYHCFGRRANGSLLSASGPCIADKPGPHGLSGELQVAEHWGLGIEPPLRPWLAWYIGWTFRSNVLADVGHCPVKKPSGVSCRRLSARFNRISGHAEIAAHHVYQLLSLLVAGCWRMVLGWGGVGISPDHDTPGLSQGGHCSLVRLHLELGRHDMSPEN